MKTDNRGGASKGVDIAACVTVNTDFTVNDIHQRIKSLAKNTVRAKLKDWHGLGLLVRLKGVMSVYRCTSEQLEQIVRSEKQGYLNADTRRKSQVKQCVNENRQKWIGARMIGKPGEKLLMIGDEA